jgi:hypothetical protein
MKNLGVARNIQSRVLAGMATFLFVTSGIASAQAGKTYSQLKAEHPGWVQAPGALVRPDCVHQLPKGATVSDGDQTGTDVTLSGQLIAHYDHCPEAPISTRHVVQDPGTGNGWVEASQWGLSLKSGDNIDLIDGYWYVPSVPETYGALIFLFNGTEPAGGGWIMQPVLQYGDNGAFGGDYWVLASWVVHNDQEYFVSSPVGVNPGDEIAGYTYQTSVSGDTLGYLIDASDQSTGQNTTLSLTATGYQWTAAYAGVLEAYNVTSCSEFPGDKGGIEMFFDTAVAHGYPKLDYIKPEKFYGAKYSYGGPSCNFNVEADGGTSFLDF